jgi:acetyl esterase/lipase
MSSPSSDGSNVIVIRDQPYGSFERNTLDIIYIPGDEPKRLVLLIHGGSWVAGDKQDVAFFSEPLIEAGYVYVSMNYRLMLTPATFNDMLNDIQTAILFLYLNASAYGIQRDAMAIGGVSAGAHLAMLYAYQLTSLIPIQFVFALVPPVDLTDPSFLEVEGAAFQLIQMNALTGTSIETPEEVILNGFPLAWLQASPIHYASTAKPTLIAYAGLDELVPLTNVPRLLARLDEFEQTYEAILFPNSRHNLMGDPDQTMLFNQRLFVLLSLYLSA